jgi:hypothetical protein
MHIAKYTLSHCLIDMPDGYVDKSLLHSQSE